MNSIKMQMNGFSLEFGDLWVTNLKLLVVEQIELKDDQLVSQWLAKYGKENLVNLVTCE